MDIQNFSIKVADFVDSWHYPLDEDRHVNAPLKNPTLGNVLGNAAAGTVIGGALGVVPSIFLGNKAVGLGALAGAGIGAYAGIESNKARSKDLEDPESAYTRRSNQFKHHILPALQQQEHEYIQAIEDNAYSHSQHAYGAAIQGGIGAMHAYKSVKREDNGRVSIDPYSAAITANMAHETYKKQQLAKAQKEEYNRRKNTPQEDLALEEQAVRERYRALHPDRREAEYERVVFGSQPSRLAKSASILGKMTTSGKIVGAASALGATAGVGYHLGRGVQIVKQSQAKTAGVREAFSKYLANLKGVNVSSAKEKLRTASVKLDVAKINNDAHNAVFGNVFGGARQGGGVADHFIRNMNKQHADNLAGAEQAFNSAKGHYDSTLNSHLKAVGGTAVGIGAVVGGGAYMNSNKTEKLASRAVELVNGKTVTDKAKQLVESGFKGKDFAGKKAPYINVNSRSLSAKAMAILGTGAAASGAIAAYNAHKDNKAQAEKSAGIVERANQFLNNDKPKGMDSEKVASFLSTAAKFVTKNPTRALATAGAGVGAVSGAAAAGDGNRVQGAITGGAVGGALGAAGGKYMASKANPDIGKLKSFAPNQIAAQNMTSKV